MVGRIRGVLLGQRPQVRQGTSLGTGQHGIYQRRVESVVLHLLVVLEPHPLRLGGARPHLAQLVGDGYAPFRVGSDLVVSHERDPGGSAVVVQLRDEELAFLNLLENRLHARLAGSASTELLERTVDGLVRDLALHVLDDTFGVGLRNDAGVDPELDVVRHLLDQAPDLGHQARALGPVLVGLALVGPPVRGEVVGDITNLALMLGGPLRLV